MRQANIVLMSLFLALSRHLDIRLLRRQRDRIALANAHSIAQFIQRIHVLLSAFAKWNVFDNETLVAPCLHGFEVKLVVLCCDVQDRRAASER